VFVDGDHASISIRLAIKLSGLSDVSFVEPDAAVRNSESFKSATPKGELPALLGGNAVGLLEVAKVVIPGHILFGNSEAQQKEVIRWLKLLSTDLVPQSKVKDNKWIGKLHKLNKDLTLNVFFIGNQLTLADLGLFPLFHEALKGWSDEERLLHANLTRWIDFIQHFDGIEGIVPIVPINKRLALEEIVPLAVKKQVEPRNDQPAVKETKNTQIDGKQVDKVDSKDQQGKPESPASTNGTKREETVGKEIKEKPGKEIKEKEVKTPKAAKQVERPVDISRLDIRVGKILDVKRHETAENLYVEQIDLGDSKTRTVVSGLVNFVPIGEMQNRIVVCVCNLKPAKIRGVSSEAMVLAASNEDHTKVELLDPPHGCKVGERVMFDGFPGDPDPQLNPKHKVWETVQSDFATTGDCIATWKGIPFKTSTGVLKVKSISKGTIK